MRTIPTTWRRSSATGWRRAIVSIALLDRAVHHVERGVGGDHAPRASAVAPGERLDGLGDLPLGKAAHLRDRACKFPQVGVETSDGMSGGRHVRDPSGTLFSYDESVTA
jgi:hypothetical protein